VHGGLQFQAIHHLFPRLPRHRLRALVPVVRALANKHGADYHVRSPRARARARAESRSPLTRTQPAHPPLPALPSR